MSRTFGSTEMKQIDATEHGGPSRLIWLTAQMKSIVPTAVRHLDRGCRLVSVLAVLLSLLLVAREPSAIASGSASERQELLALDPQRPSVRSGLAPSYRFGVVKQFEETSYYLKDLDFVNAMVGWAVGDTHWDQTRKTYIGTIVKTSDAGETWTTQEAGVSVALYDVDFVDENLGWAVGANGTILHTSDGGTHWITQTLAISDELRSVVFVDANRGWAVSIRPTHYDYRGEADRWQAGIWHTGNGGHTWIQQTVPGNASILHDVDFVDTQTGWAVGAKYIGDDPYGRPMHRAVVYHTADGGLTWSELYDPDLEVTFTAVELLDASHGWVVGFPTRSDVTGGFVFHTADGGATWDRQTPGSFSASLWDVQFTDPDRGYVVGRNYVAAWGPPVYRTLDGGATWTAVRMEKHENDGLLGVAIVGDQVVAIGDHDYVIKSTQAWDPCEPADPYSTCLDCVCLFRQFYTNVHYAFQDAYFVDEAHGWVVGSRSFEPELWGQVILHTQDGGLTWDTQYEQAPPDDLFSYHRLDSVYFADLQNGWAVGTAKFYGYSLEWPYQGAILHTTDGGLHWQQQGNEIYDGRQREFFGVQTLDSQTAWALAAAYFPSNDIFLAHTTNAGDQWSWVDTGITGTLAVGFALVQGDVVFSDAQHGWAFGGMGQIVHTTDGGSSWVRQELTCDWPLCSNPLYAAAFINNQEGWLAGRGLFRTTDGGALWTEQDIEIEETDTVELQDIQFVDSLHGWLTGDYGVILYTANGGDSWTQVDNDASFSALRGLSFVSPEEGWFVGDGGVILTTSQIPYWPVYLPQVTKIDTR
jgi:photosystem II stability/assembly factor-like uncharacterized protein